MSSPTQASVLSPGAVHGRSSHHTVLSTDGTGLIHTGGNHDRAVGGAMTEDVVGGVTQTLRSGRAQTVHGGDSVLVNSGCEVAIHGGLTSTTKGGPMEALAAIERTTGATFAISPARPAAPAAVEAVRLSLSGDEVRALLAASGHQRRITFRLPPSRLSRAVPGADGPLGGRAQEITGTLVRPPATRWAQAAALDPAERLDVELSAVELREAYARAPTAATTTEPPATRGVPSGSQSGST